jgi:uncharacterized membrane protein
MVGITCSPHLNGGQVYAAVLMAGPTAPEQLQLWSLHTSIIKLVAAQANPAAALLPGNVALKYMRYSVATAAHMLDMHTGLSIGRGCITASAVPWLVLCMRCMRLLGWQLQRVDQQAAAAAAGGEDSADEIIRAFAGIMQLLGLLEAAWTVAMHIEATLMRTLKHGPGKLLRHC